MTAAPRSAPIDEMQHAAGYYRTEDDLVRQVLPLVGDSMERGDAIALAVQPAVAEALHSAFGKGLRGVLQMDHPDGPQGTSGQSMVTRRARLLDRLHSTSGTVTTITQHDSRFDGPDGRFWTELDAAANVALSNRPLRLTCFFPETPRHPSILDGVRWNHPFLLVDGTMKRNGEFRAPREVLSEIPTPAPDLLGPSARRLSFGLRELVDVRNVIEAALRDSSVGSPRIDDLVVAINEVATNAVEHGTAPATIDVWTDPTGCVVEVHDSGVLTDPLPGLHCPHPDESHGWGMWVARQACDYLHVWGDHTGTHVRIRVGAEHLRTG